MRVVTIGGGHGQAALLAALLRLDCTVTAVVSVADDGGCSGKLRSELGMAPPGDLRRCLSTLAADRALAGQFEARLDEPGMEGRSAGNLVLAEAYREMGSLQAAVDWAAALLRCRGRVVAAAEDPAVLAVYDRENGEVEGETTVAEKSQMPLVVGVRGPAVANPAAIEAIEAADIVLIGPGSFVTSVLATLGTADLARAFVRARGQCVLVANLRPEGQLLQGFEIADYVRLVRDHITIYSSGHRVSLAVLVDQPGGHSRSRLADGTPRLASPLAAPGTHIHDPARLALSLTEHLGLIARPNAAVAPDAEHENRSHQHFAASLARARTRLGQ
ncbi:MAG: 2-phospho-L-lactate transferase CofD family protein [Proteobacteria bacterium]|nr:2-phospho-L-lactate transferase CofD family protein [Pseudomonadota bacterium]